MSGNFKYYIRIIGIMLIFTACSALLLASINALTVDKIENNRMTEFMRAVEVIFPDSTEITEHEIKTESPVDVVYNVKNADITIGYCIKSVPKGFDGDIEIIIGTDLSGKILGVQIISHSETPGLGSRVAEESYLTGYIGMSGDIKFNQDIDAVAGATVTSKAVFTGINAAMAINGLFDDGGTEQ